MALRLRDVQRLRLSIDQACGVNLGAVMDARRKIAAKSGRLEDLVALGALLADLREFSEADRVYRQALRSYSDVSPFAVAWVCFQLGVLWGELASEPDLAVAEQWYRKAITCLPGYVKARVHLAEIYSSDGRTDEAESILVPALPSGDPEVRWRLADLLTAQGRHRRSRCATGCRAIGVRGASRKAPAGIRRSRRRILRRQRRRCLTGPRTRPHQRQQPTNAQRL